MKTLTNKFFQVLERNLSLKEFENWLYSLDNAASLRDDNQYREFFALNYGSKEAAYEFGKLLNKFNLDEYAQYKFENSLKQILSDGNLFRVVRSCNDFYLRHDYTAFGLIGAYDYELGSEFLAYRETKEQLASTAETLLAQWNSLGTAHARIAFLKGKFGFASKPAAVESSSYERFSGKLWKFWKN